jgi:hypothetical protein
MLTLGDNNPQKWSGEDLQAKFGRRAGFLAAPRRRPQRLPSGFG